MMVTDTQLIARVADMSIYICRADYTHKNDYQLINELYNNKRLPNLCTVINGLDMTKKKYGYYYGYGKYGKYYGYGKKYGYGYGYGYGDTYHSIINIYPISPGTSNRSRFRAYFLFVLPVCCGSRALAAARHNFSINRT